LNKKNILGTGLNLKSGTLSKSEDRIVEGMGSKFPEIFRFFGFRA